MKRFITVRMVVPLLSAAVAQATMQKIALFNRANSAILVCFSKTMCKPLWKHTVEPGSEKILFSADLKYREGRPLYLNVAMNGNTNTFTITYHRAPIDCNAPKQEHGCRAGSASTAVSNLVKIRRGSEVVDEMEYDASTHSLSLVFDKDANLMFNRLQQTKVVCPPEKCHKTRHDHDERVARKAQEKGSKRCFTPMCRDN